MSQIQHTTGERNFLNPFSLTTQIFWSNNTFDKLITIKKITWNTYVYECINLVILQYTSIKISLDII